MKKVKIIGIILLAISITASGFARPRPHHRGHHTHHNHPHIRYRPAPHHHHGHHHSDNWWIPATILAGASFVSSVVRSTPDVVYTSTPNVVYVNNTPPQPQQTTVVVQEAPTKRIIREEIRADGSRVVYYEQ